MRSALDPMAPRVLFDAPRPGRVQLHGERRPVITGRQMLLAMAGLALFVAGYGYGYVVRTRAELVERTAVGAAIVGDGGAALPPRRGDATGATIN